VVERPAQTVGETSRQDSGVDRTRDRRAGRDAREDGDAEHVLDVGSAEGTAVLVDQDRADGVDDGGMADGPPETQVATAHHDDPRAGDLGKGTSRRIVEATEVAHAGAGIGIERHRERGAGLGQGGAAVRIAGREQREPGRDLEREMLERVDRCARPRAHPVGETGNGIVREPENSRLVAREVDDPRVRFAREHQRGRGRDDRRTGAALRRPEAHEHEKLPTSGAPGPARNARTTGKSWGKSLRTLGVRRPRRQGELRAENIGLRFVEAAFFDLDKTVIATSSVMALGGTFYRDGLISKRTIVRGLYAQVVYLLVGADENKMDRMREAMLVLTKGWDQQHVQELVRETLDDVLTPIIYAEALELIEEHRKAGRKTVIVSSSPAETVGPIGDYLGVDDVIATRARLDEQGRYTGELEFYAYAAHKADAIREMAVTEKLDLASSYAYSDSITDLPMLELVGHPVAVNPDRELARVAREREWEVRYFQRPVRLRDRVPVPPKGPTLAAGGVAIAAGTAVGVYVWLRKRTS
jgi:HAD superfamily hydrolase (TIGR01490 family)